MNWRLWLAQIHAILRIEFKKSFWGRRAIWIYLLAFAPLVIIGIHAAMVWLGRDRCTGNEDLVIFAAIFHFYYLRLAIFFGSVGIFATLIRGEVLEKTLHYYLLAPVRREVWIAGKFIAGVLASSAYFLISVLIGFLLITRHQGAVSDQFYASGAGFEQLTSYLTATVLGCIGYGAVFLAMSLLFKNPMIPAAIVMVWEGINIFLPSMLKKFSVIFYLKSLLPVEVPLEGPFILFAIEADPVPAYLAIPGLLATAALVLIYAAYKCRRLEISYSE